MTSSDERPPKFRRRLFWLAAFVVVLFGVYSAGWFYLAGRVRSEADKAVATLNAKGIEAGCANLTVSGYPLSFAVSCDNLAYEDDTRNVAASTGSFNFVAEIIRPLSPVAELRGPLRTSVPGMAPLWIDWDNLQANAKLSWPLPRSISLQAEGLSGQTDPADDTDPVSTVQRRDGGGRAAARTARTSAMSAASPTLRSMPTRSAGACCRRSTAAATRR